MQNIFLSQFVHEPEPMLRKPLSYTTRDTAVMLLQVHKGNVEWLDELQNNKQTQLYNDCKDFADIILIFVS